MTNHTPATLDAMTPAELNRAVAEALNLTCVGVMEINGQAEYIYRDDNMPGDWKLTVGNWSIDANAALGLLREMNEALSLGDSVYEVAYHPTAGGWYVSQLGHLPNVYPFAPTAPAAIVKAWLLWQQEAGE